MSLKKKAGILVTNNLNDRMKKKQKIIYLIFKEVVKINNETLEENKSERTFETPCTTGR